MRSTMRSWQRKVVTFTNKILWNIWEIYLQKKTYDLSYTQGIDLVKNRLIDSSPKEFTYRVGSLKS